MSQPLSIATRNVVNFSAIAHSRLRERPPGCLLPNMDNSIEKYLSGWADRCEAGSLFPAFPPRTAAMNKYSAGTVAVCGGSARYPHAPVLAAMGARAAGAGLVQMDVPPESRFAAAVHVPEAVFSDVSAGLPRPGAAAAGMGIDDPGRADALLDRLLSLPQAQCPRLVLDASLLDALARRVGNGDRGSFPADGRLVVITPHEGEAARMLGCGIADVKADRAGAAAALRDKYSSVVVLKGAGTLVLGLDAAASPVECRAGNPFMAAAGMGDILAGAIAARWARLAAFSAGAANPPRGEYICETAVLSAVWLHSCAADSLAEQNPAAELTAANMAARIASMRIALESGRK